MQRLLSAAPALVCDLAGLAGGAAVTYGVWSIYHPAGWIIGGGLALAGAWLVASRVEGPAER